MHSNLSSLVFFTFFIGAHQLGQLLSAIRLAQSATLDDMAMFVIKKCPHCGQVFDHGTDKRGIGVPFTKCPSCQADIVDQDFTEWELMGLGQRLGYAFICIYTAFIYGIAVPFIHYLLDKEAAVKSLAFTYPLGVVVFAVILWVRNSKDIESSKQRMRDPAHRQKLVRLGLLRE